MDKYIASLSESERRHLAKKVLNHTTDKNGRHLWFNRLNAGISSTRISKERAQEILDRYGLSVEKFLGNDIASQTQRLDAVINPDAAFAHFRKINEAQYELGDCIEDYTDELNRITIKLTLDKFSPTEYGALWAKGTAFRRKRNLLIQHRAILESKKIEWARKTGIFAYDPLGNIGYDLPDEYVTRTLQNARALYDELNDQRIKAGMKDSLERAAHFAFDRYKDACRLKRLSDAYRELELFNICRLALNQLAA